MKSLHALDDSGLETLKTKKAHITKGMSVAERVAAKKLARKQERKRQELEDASNHFCRDIMNEKDWDPAQLFQATIEVEKRADA